MAFTNNRVTDGGGVSSGTNKADKALKATLTQKGPSAQKLAQLENAKKVTPTTTTSTRSGSGTTTSTSNTTNTSSYSNALADYMSNLDSLASKISEYQAMQDKLAQENYEAQLRANEQSAKEQRNQANLNSARTQRWLDAQYGGGLSGQGLTNTLRNKTNLTNNIASINTSLANNNASANLSRYNTLSNNLDNTISRLQTIDDSRLNAKLKYANYLNELGL